MKQAKKHYWLIDQDNRAHGPFNSWKAGYEYGRLTWNVSRFTVVDKHPGKRVEFIVTNTTSYIRRTLVGVR